MRLQGGQSRSGRADDELDPAAMAAVSTPVELAALLRQLRRRQARRTIGPELSYREIAVKTGWSHGAVGQYLSGRTLPPIDRFDTLVQLLGAAPGEQRGLATARDRIDERRRSVLDPPSGERPARPRQLPADLVSFTGRDGALAALDRLRRPAADQPAAPVLIVSGMAGVGKTTLVVHWAHRVADDFPDGQLYVNLRGFDPVRPALSVGQTARGFLDALGVPPARVPAEEDTQIALYRSTLADRRMLIILDNVSSAEQARALLPGAPRCLVLVTSRHQLTGLAATHGAQRLTLDVLSRPEARRLLARRLGAEVMASEAQAVETLIDACARLPLALAVAAARAAAGTGRPMAELVAEFSDGPARLDALEIGDVGTDVRAVFSWSYRRLAPPAARLFRLLGQHPGQSITAPAAASLAALSLAAVQPLLAELVAAHLVTEPAPGRFGLHDLLRAYAAELCTEADAAETVTRILDHYAHTAHRAAMLADPHQLPLAFDPPLAGVVPEQQADGDRAKEWFAAEHEVLLAALAHGVERGLDRQVWLLAAGMSTFLDLGGHWHDWAAVLTAGLSAAQRLERLPEQTHMHRRLGMAYHRLGRRDDGDRQLQVALRLCETYGDRQELARIHIGLGIVRSGQGRFREALEHAGQAHGHAVAAGDLPARANILNGMAWCLVQLGEPRRALAECRRALTLFAGAEDRHGEAEAWDTRGLIYSELGDPGRAVESYLRALALFREIRARHPEGDTLHRLGDAQHARGEAAAALEAWQEALLILAELGHPDADQVRAKIGQTHAGERGTST